MKLAIVIPAYNEEGSIGKVVEKIPKNIPGVSEVIKIVVNDNSRDKTAKVASAAGATVLTHRINLGAGGATTTGLTYAKQIGADAVVTLDGDGQHNPTEIAQLVAEYGKGQSQLIIGSRFMSTTIKDMPGLKNFGNRVMNFITYIFSGKLVTDSQSGFRLLGRMVLDNSKSIITTNGYEFCSEMIINSRKQGINIAEVPISTIYFADRKGQNPINGINIFMRLLYRAVVG